MSFLKPRYQCDFCGMIAEARRNVNDVPISGKVWQEPSGWIQGAKNPYLTACMKSTCRENLKLVDK